MRQQQVIDTTEQLPRPDGTSIAFCVECSSGFLSTDPETDCLCAKCAAAPSPLRPETPEEIEQREWDRRWSSDGFDGLD